MDGALVRPCSWQNEKVFVNLSDCILFENMKIKATIILALCTMLACSCGTYKRQAYLQDMEVGKEYQCVSRPDAKIRIGDKLRIVVTCTSPELAAPFNVITGNVTYDPATKKVIPYSGSMEEKGYVVDRDGYITFPVIGKLNVVDLTLEELKLLVEGQLKGRNYIKDPIVYTDFLNFQVTVLGEAGVGNYNISSGGVNIFELLAMAKDLTGDAVRDNVKVIRTEGNTRKAYNINLKSVDCYNSPVFYLQQNDMVYAMPRDDKFDTKTQNVFTVGTFVLSLGTVVTNILVWSGLARR